ncbi:MAG: hypothetical protein ABIJ82_02755 [Patescibacteria group bacterium]|nr:hypothetical protein [Patescibacteria group bacterium]MBU1952601.1 hypothetical protein [Patescibacteria group bacterium]
MDTTIVVKLPRKSPFTQYITQLCQENFGSASWNNGRGRRFGTLKCEFRNVRNVADFVLELMQCGFTINVEAYL